MCELHSALMSDLFCHPQLIKVNMDETVFVLLVLTGEM